MNARNIVCVLSLACLLSACSEPVRVAGDGAYYNEVWRQQYHFSPPEGLMNDPVGLVYHKGEYHLMYDHSGGKAPAGWCGAVSTDLLHWKHLPQAISSPDELGWVWSGSCVADDNNTSGLVPGGGLVAIYTRHVQGNVSGESQCLAYSLDKGRTWTKYKGNPVLPNPYPTDSKTPTDFRDPKAFWYPPDNHWVALVAGGYPRFYTSDNLKDWHFQSDNDGGMWTECPDIFELPVDGDAKNTRWVLSRGGSDYIIGKFDGKRFTRDAHDGDNTRLDYGGDFYAAQSWNNIPASDGRRIYLGWMSSSIHLMGRMPTTPWKGQMALPRVLLLKTFPEGVRLAQTPIKELQALRARKFKFGPRIVGPDNDLLAKVRGDTVEIVAEFEPGTASEFGFKVRKSDRQQTVIGYDVKGGKLFVDRSKHGNFGPGPDWPKELKLWEDKHEGPMPLVNGRVRMHIFVDRSSVEVFGNDGYRVMSNLIFPDVASQGMELYCAGGSVKLISLEVYLLKSAW